MAEYYYLLSGAPDLELNNEKLTVGMTEFRELFEEQSSKSDRAVMAVFFLRYDCENIVSLLENAKAEIGTLGNYSREECLELIRNARSTFDDIEGYPEFLVEFIRAYNINKEKDGFFPSDEILLQFYEYAAKHSKSTIIGEWWQLQLDINNILTAIIARQKGWDIKQFVKGEGDVQDMIRQNNTADFNLSSQYDFASEVISIAAETDPLEKERKIDAMKWLWLNERTFMDGFSIEAVFAYFCKLEMLTRWERLNPTEGKARLQEIIENLRGTAKVPDEFKV